VIAATTAIAMTKFQKTIIGAMLAAAVGTAILAVHQNLQLQDKIQTLQQQQTFLMQQVRQLKEAHLETEQQVAALQAPPPAAHTNAMTRADNTSGGSPRTDTTIDTNTIPSNMLETELERGLSESTWGGREAALERLGKNISTNDLPRALAFLVQRPGPNGLETPLFDHLASRWGEADPHAAIAWANSLQDTNAQARALTKVLLGWSKQHREEAIGFAAEMPAGNLQNAAVKQVVGDWTFWDAPNAAKWLGQNPQFADQTLGDLIFWGQGACPAAIADLLDQQYSLGHTNWLQDHGAEVASIWLNRDKAAARTWIEQAPLPDETKQRLLKRDH
jgi:hypothetical protein